MLPHTILGGSKATISEALLISCEAGEPLSQEARNGWETLISAVYMFYEPGKVTSSLWASVSSSIK